MATRTLPNGLRKPHPVAPGVGALSLGLTLADGVAGFLVAGMLVGA